MPIEIRELIIKATVVNDNGSQPSNGAPANNNAVTVNEEIINICVEKVLEILKDKHER